MIEDGNDEIHRPTPYACLFRRVVDQYNAVLLMAVPQVVDEIAAEAAKEAAQHKIDLFAGSHDADDAEKAARFIDQVENGFYESMADEIDKLKKAMGTS